VINKVALEEKVKKIDIDKTAVNKIAFAIEQKQAEMRMKQSEIDNHRVQYGSAEQHIKELEETLKKVEVDRARLVDLRDELFIYEQLERAFGKDGIPALILENVIPEIEAEANNILSRLSSGNMRINLLTQREKKSGGLTETLDIIISNEKGSRPYESYSGGQKMRINMAIRLALSKILCGRSGTKIETVIIDEVDALDEAGVRGFVSVINDMHKLFKKIIIISHISELKEYFKKTITVNMTRDGSSNIIS
jgi:exonuclease SbcC